MDTHVRKSSNSPKVSKEVHAGLRGATKEVKGIMASAGIHNILAKKSSSKMQPQNTSSKRGQTKEVQRLMSSAQLNNILAKKSSSKMDNNNNNNMMDTK